MAVALQQIDSTRLGDRAFSHPHNTSSTTEAEYDRLRSLARQEASSRQSCLSRAHAAYTSGDGATAHQLSEEGKRHAALAEQYNRQAAEFIFRENNAVGRVDGDTIDLHGLYVEEAEGVLEGRIRDARARSQQHLHVIVGKGNHSYNHVQKLKPCVERICREEGLQYATEENEGRIYINLTGGPAPEHFASGHGGGYHGGHQQHGQQGYGPAQQYGGQADYGQGGGYPGQEQQYYGGQQQYHGGQQQQQQHHGGGHGQQHQQTTEDEVVKAAKKLLPRLFRSCCVVM